MSNQKIIICYTGEPRALRKSLRKREKAFDRHYKNEYIIESNYLIYFSYNQNLRNTVLIFNKLKYIGEDKLLNNLTLENRQYGENIYKFILEQKYNLIQSIMRENNLDENDSLILTRTDWLFTYETRKLIDCSKRNNKIVTPFLSDSKYKHNGIEYKGIFDQIFIIPGNLAKDMLIALEASIKFCDDQFPSTTKNLMAGGNGMNRFGLTPEQLFGLGFSKCNLWESHKSIKLEYSYPANMYNASRHNLIRHDAYIWMNLSLNDFFTKYIIMYLKPLIIIKIKNFLKFLNIKDGN